jgi:hypothetical protein
MPATSTVVGATLGLGVQLYSNAVRKLPLLRSARPHCPGERSWLRLRVPPAPHRRVHTRLRQP